MLLFEYIKMKTAAIPLYDRPVKLQERHRSAAELMITNEFGKGLLFGNITGVPTDVVILGAGTVGEFAAKTAIGLV
jgi:alanine dehydrogenase